MTFLMHATQVVDDLARSGAVDCVALDSVAALVPRSELEGSIGDMQARAWTRCIRILFEINVQITWGGYMKEA